MALDERVRFVIEVMRQTTRDNRGVIIAPLGLEEGVLRIRYYEGTNPDCPECVMPPEAFKQMVEELCRVQAPHVRAVEIVPAR